MRVLLDTNVLSVCIVSAIRPASTAPTRIWQRWLDKHFELLFSQHILNELERTFADPWFVTHLPADARSHQIARLLQTATQVQVTSVVSQVASHPADDLVLAAAVSGNADYLVTGDAKFRRVDEYEGVKLRTPAEFLTELDTKSG